MANVVFPQFYIPQRERPDNTRNDTITRGIFDLVGRLIATGASLYEGAQNRESEKYKTDILDKSREKDRLHQSEIEKAKREFQLSAEEAQREFQREQAIRSLAAKLGEEARNIGYSGEGPQFETAREQGAMIPLQAAIGKYIAPSTRQQMKSDEELAKRYSTPLSPELQAEELGKLSKMLPGRPPSEKLAVEQEKTAREKMMAEERSKLKRMTIGSQVLIARMRNSTALTNMLQKGINDYNELVSKNNMDKFVKMGVIPETEKMTPEEQDEAKAAIVARYREIFNKMPGGTPPDISLTAQEISKTKAPAKPAQGMAPPKQSQSFKKPVRTREQIQKWAQEVSERTGVPIEDVLKRISGQVIIQD